MWRHILREGGRNNLIIVSHRCGGGSSSPPLNRAEWIRASVLFLSPSSAASSSRHHSPLASLSPSPSLPLHAKLYRPLYARLREFARKASIPTTFDSKSTEEKSTACSKSGGRRVKADVAPNEKCQTDFRQGNVQEGTQKAESQMASYEFVARFALCIRTTDTPLHLSFLSLPSPLLYHNFFHFLFCPDWNVFLETPDNFYRVAIRWEKNAIQVCNTLYKIHLLISNIRIKNNVYIYFVCIYFCKKDYIYVYLFKILFNIIC